MTSLLIRSTARLTASKTLQISTPIVHQIVTRGRSRDSLSLSIRSSSSAAAISESGDDDEGPGGDLLLAKVGPELLGKSAWTRRTFDPRSNSLSLLTCGGQALAKHASFDPEYNRARHWIRHHPVGPAVLSPVLINGLVGALVEASVPQSIPVSSSMRQVRPLIVGVEVCARIEVKCVSNDAMDCETSGAVGEVYERKNGYQVELKTEVSRVRDGATIAEGTHTIWVPDYLHM